MPGASGQEAAQPAVLAPMAGTLLDWKVAEGETVTAGQAVAVMEAMKMETQVTAPVAGTLRRRVAAGAAVSAGDVLGEIV